MWNISKYGQILVPKLEIKVPKIGNLVCFGLKPYVEKPNSQHFLDQYGCYVEIIKGKKGGKNLRYRAAMVTKIVNKKYLKIY